MHIGLVRLLKRGVPGSLLKQLWSPSLFCQGGEHAVAKNVRRDRQTRVGSESPEECVYVCIAERLTCTCSLAFEEQVIRFHFSRVYAPNVGHDFVNELR